MAKHRIRRASWWMGLAYACVLATGCAPQSVLITPVSVRRDLVEETLLREPGWFPAKIALIDVDGILLNMREPEFFGEGEHPVSLLLEQLDEARRDPAVKAAVLRINSPGGSVTASELMHDEITRFRGSGKPVVAVMMDVAASGGYYIACACDEIWAHQSTVTGSIGVLVQLFDFTGTMQKIGMTAPAITSGPNKDAGSPFQTLTLEQRAIFQGIVDEFYDGFVEAVVQGRPALNEQQVRELADGRVYTATQARENGLIDRIGTLRDALSAVKERVGARSVRVVGYHRPLEYKPNYYARGYPPSPRAGDVNVVNIDLPAPLGATTPQFLYLWAPGL